MSASYELVPFHEHQILTVREGEDVIVPLKPVVDAIGLAWHGQFERINRHPVLSKGIRVTRIPSQGGMQETVGLTLNMLPGFLTTIESSRIKDPEVRIRVELFQSEAFEVLFEHFFGGIKAATQIEASDRVARRRELPALLERLERSRHGESQRILHELVVRACEAEGIDPPLLEAYHLPNKDDHEAEALLAQIDAMIEAGTLANLHRVQDAFIAVRRKDLEALRILIHPALRDALIRHSRYKRYGSVSIKGGKSAHCWVFTRA